MIVELHLTQREDERIASHLRRCRKAACADIAHLCAALVDRYDDVAEVFTFVDVSRWRHRRKLGQAKRRAQRDVERATSRPQPQRSTLDVIREAWDRQETDLPAEGTQ